MMLSFITIVFITGWILVGDSANIDTGNNTREYTCACTLEYLPLCGSDLNTYPNYCNLQCAMERTPGLHAICSSPCPCAVSEESDVNDEHLSGDLNLETSYTSFTPKSQENKETSNSGENDTGSSERCMCPRIFYPVCGSNNITYNNECVLICDQQQNKDLVKVQDGEC